jgi:hypothetical protein
MCTQNDVKKRDDKFLDTLRLGDSKTQNNLDVLNKTSFYLF